MRAAWLSEGAVSTHRSLASMLFLLPPGCEVDAAARASFHLSWGPRGPVETRPATVFSVPAFHGEGCQACPTHGAAWECQGLSGRVGCQALALTGCPGSRTSDFSRREASAMSLSLSLHREPHVHPGRQGLGCRAWPPPRDMLRHRSVRGSLAQGGPEVGGEASTLSS